MGTPTNEKYRLFRLVLLFFSFVSVSSNTGLKEEDINNIVKVPAKFVIENTNRKNIRNFLRHLTLKPHIGGTPAEWETAEWLAQQWRDQGMDEVHLVPYDVLLSYPNQEKPNYARILDGNGEEAWKSQGRSIPLKAKEEFSQDVPPDFNAYSPSGQIQGDVVFANFGRDEDFELLLNMSVNVQGKIVIAKYGKMFRGNIAKNAETRSAAGLLLYSDPQDAAKNGLSDVYPNSIYLPGGAAPMGTVYLDEGDPLTPHYPSIESAFRIPEGEAAIPKIPVMPLGYNDAEAILRRMGGAISPKEWQGGLNLTYRMGPGFEQQGWKLSLEVNTYSKRTTTYNVIGIVKGAIEPDRYVVMGNHRDAWIFGAIDPSSGTAAMLEVSRVILDYRNKTNWKPRRSIVFASWGSEEYGLIGSNEWTEQFGKQLSNRAVVYINVDAAIMGNYTLLCGSTPMLYGVIREVSKLIPNPDEQELRAGRNSVYDSWLMRSPDLKHQGLPSFKGIGSGSDYKGFQHNLGIPSVDLMYSYSEEVGSEPLYHTLHESFFLVEMYDRNFNFHAAVAQLSAIAGILLADSQIIPYSLESYAAFISEAQQDLINTHGEHLTKANISLEYFTNASKHFTESTSRFVTEVERSNLTSPFLVRKLNDQLMLVERSFIDPNGLPGRPYYNHVLHAPSVHDSYLGVAFSGLWDALDGFHALPEEVQKVRWRTFKEHLAVVTFLIDTAAKVLTDDLW